MQLGSARIRITTCRCKWWFKKTAVLSNTSSEVPLIRWRSFRGKRPTTTATRVTRAAIGRAQKCIKMLRMGASKISLWETRGSWSLAWAWKHTIFRRPPILPQEGFLAWSHASSAKARKSGDASRRTARRAKVLVCSVWKNSRDSWRWSEERSLSVWSAVCVMLCSTLEEDSKLRNQRVILPSKKKLCPKFLNLMTILWRRVSSGRPKRNCPWGRRRIGFSRLS